MGLYKDRLIFDTSDVSESDQIGSFLIGAGGNVLTETNVGSDYGLDVNLINASIVVSASALDIRDLDYSKDNLVIKNSSGTELAIDGSGYLTVNVNGTVAVSATNLDIRDLTHVSDSIKVGDGVDFIAVNGDGSINVNFAGVADDAADSGNPVKVGSRAINGALSAISASNDRADAISDMYRRIYVNNAPNINIAHNAVSVANTATQIASTALLGRVRILIQNLGAQDVFVGGAGVSISNGLRVAKGATLELPFGEDIAIYGITASATSDVRYFEVA